MCAQTSPLLPPGLVSSAASQERSERPGLWLFKHCTGSVHLCYVTPKLSSEKAAVAKPSGGNIQTLELASGPPGSQWLPAGAALKERMSLARGGW